MSVSDPSKALVVHSRWDAPGDPTSPTVVYAVEAGRRRIGVWVPPLAAVLGVAAWLLGAPGVVAAMAAGALALAAVGYSVLGGTGYYELAPDGRLGTPLGRQVPDLEGRRRSRVRGGDVVARA